MLALPAPSSRGYDRAVSITGPAVSANRIAAVTGRYGCPPSVRDKVETCIRHSERYDCRVDHLLAFGPILEKLRRELAVHGASIEVRD